MVRVCSVPTPVMRLERVMRPANTGVCAANHDSLPSEPERPDIRGVRILDSRLDRRRRSRSAGSQSRLLDWPSLREIVVNHGIPLDTRHLRPSSQRVGDLPSTFHQNSVDDIKRLIFDVALAQPLQDWRLRRLGLFQQGLINEPALFRLGWQTGRAAQIGLICEHNKKFSLLSVGRVFHHPRRNLVRRSRSRSLADWRDLMAYAVVRQRSDRAQIERP